MQPATSQTDRERLFFCYRMDCQTPRKPGGAPDQTWEVAERAVRGLAELFADRGLTHALGFAAEPEVAVRQAGMFREMALAGCWQCLHFQVRGYRPQGAAQDYDWERALTFYDYEEQRQVIGIARDEWQQALGMPAENFGACCLQANDFTFPILEELGFRQSYCSGPGRHDPRRGHFWWGAFPHSHHASSRSRLVCGELQLYETPGTRQLRPEPGPEPGTWRTVDFRAENEKSFDETMRIAAENIEDMIRRDHPVLYIHAATHNTWDVGDRASARRRAVETVIEVVHVLAEQHGLELVPASWQDIHREADRLNAY